MGKASHFVLKNPMQQFLLCHYFTSNGTEVHRLGQGHVAKKRKKLRFQLYRAFEQRACLLFLCFFFFLELAFLTTHSTTLSIKKKNKRAHRASEDMCSDIILIDDLGQEISPLFCKYLSTM